MRSLTIVFLILSGLFSSSTIAAAAVSNDRVFAFAEGKYSSYFHSSYFPVTATTAEYQQYTYRYYPPTGNYLAIDTSGVISVLGPMSANAITPVGSVADFADAITDWEATIAAAAVYNDRVFAFAEGKYSSYFPVTATTAQYQQYSYRYYPSTGNYLAIDTSGVISVLGPMSANAITPVGSVADFADAITDWEATIAAPPAINKPPVAISGANQTVPLNSLVTLDGSGSNDPEGKSLIYQWSLTAPSGSIASLSDVNALQPTFTPDITGVYTAQLIVNDGLVSSAPSFTEITTQVKINNLNPAQASSSSLITLTGSNFTPSSKVMLGTQSIIPQYLSDTLLTFVVPFSLDQNSALVPLQSGQYAIQVDSSNTVDLAVVDLPINPNPPGQLLADQINTTFQSLAVNVPEFQAMLPQLLSDQQGNPGTQKFINDLAALANLVNSPALQTELTNLTSQIDLQSLDTLERSLLANQNSSSTPAAAVANSAPQLMASRMGALSLAPPLTTTSCNSLTNGDEWLDCRKQYRPISGLPVSALEAAQVFDQLSTYSGYCGKAMTVFSLLTGGSSLLIAGTCSIIGTLSSLTSTLSVISIAHNSGTLRGFELNISGVDTYDTSGHTRVPIPTELDISLGLNNYDNNEILSSQTASAKHITGARLLISTTQDWVNIASSLKSTIGSYSDFLTPILKATALKELTQKVISLAVNLGENIIDSGINTPDKALEISNANISSIAGKLNPIYPTFNGLCGDLIDVDFIKSMKQTPSPNYDWLVNDIRLAYHDFLTATTNKGCTYRVSDTYRLPTEDLIETYVKFNISIYKKITLTVFGDGYVTYGGQQPLSNKTSCIPIFSTVTCNEYFDTSSGLQPLTLTAKNLDGSDATAVTWSGYGTESCTNSSAICVVAPDSFFQGRPTITATIGYKEKLTLTVVGYGNVTYDVTSISGKTACISTDSPCVEEFIFPHETALPHFIALTATNFDGSPATNATWAGIGAENCTGERAVCLAKLVFNEYQTPLPITVNNCAAPPIKVGNLEVQNCDYESSTHERYFFAPEAWAVAKSYGPGWRLPTAEELKTMIGFMIDIPGIGTRRGAIGIALEGYHWTRHPTLEEASTPYSCSYNNNSLSMHCTYTRSDGKWAVRAVKPI